MRSIVVYFSQTGNTRKVAQALQEGIKKATGTCDAAPMKGFNPNELKAYDFVGLGCPVYDWDAPQPVKDFLDKWRGLEDKQAFFFASHGPYRGGVFTDLAQHALNRITVVGYRSWYGEVRMQHVPKPYFTDGHPDEQDLAEARQWGAEMAQLGQKVASGELPRQQADQCPDLIWGKRRVNPGYQQVPGGAQRVLGLHDVPLTYDRMKCTYPKCHICIDNCPVDCINLEAKPPVIQGKGCLDCGFCEKICPTGAIDAEWAPLAKFWRGFIPTNVRLSIETAARKGYFRSLIPPDAPVEDGTPFYVLNSRRPRIKIGQV